MMNVNSTKQFDLLTTEEQTQLIEWCKGLDKSLLINKQHSSHGIRELFQHGGGFYVTNGALKKAMLLAGFDYKESDTRINWWFNVSKKSIQSLRMSKGA